MINPINHGAYIAWRYAQLGKRMEVVIFIGHHPAVILGALSRGGQDTNELEIMGGLLEEPLQLTSAETVDIPVPAHAEIAIEGVIDPQNMVTDGPFAEYLGYYGEGDKPCYLIQITAMTMRRDAIYHGLDPAHREHNLSAVLALESQTYDIVKRAVPTTKAIHFPAYGGCNAVIHVSIEKQVQGQGKFTALAALAACNRAKIAIVVDEDIDVYDEQEVLWAMATRVTGDLDIVHIPGVTGAHLDPTSYDETRLKRGPITTRTIIDATRPVTLPFATRITPPKELWNSMNIDYYLNIY
jgi:2,5-furandicarboxylate decarboxylase 1